MNKKRAGGSPTDSVENRPPPNKDACGTRVFGSFANTEGWRTLCMLNKFGPFDEAL